MLKLSILTLGGRLNRMRGLFFALSVALMITFYCFGIYSLATNESIRHGILFLIFAIIFGLQARQIGWGSE